VTSELRYFQKGFGLKAEVQDQLLGDYHSSLVAGLKASGRNELSAPGLTLRLAREFGFCYGVDRAIDYAYETRRKFPERRIFLVGEIIHNPGVNERLTEMGIEFLTGDEPPEVAFEGLTAEDVVIIPAFGVTTSQMASLKAIGCVLVDTTCGSVLNVWKRVERYARDGFTSVIHGKHYHEETQATASRALAHGAHYLVVRDMEEAEIACDFLRGKVGADALRQRFARATSPGFDPDKHLHRIGVANQTTMLMSESLAIARRLQAVVGEVFGEDYAKANFLSFDTICSATQDRQDAVVKLLDEGVDVMVVIGGYNSSNTANLAHICAERVPTFHVATSSCIQADGSIRHLPAGTKSEATAPTWLPAGEVRIGVTAGASTPDSEVGAVIERVLALRGLTSADVVEPATA
jgi:4-hydroxy-3-methylbut-2-enyl diphosphate reductase